MKTIKKLFLLILISFVASLSPCPTAFAESDGFIIYNEYNEIVCERSSIEIGDTFITPEFYEYEIISIENHTAKAKLVKKITPPTIKKEENVRKRKMAKRGALTKKICLYLTHNDESYVPTDGYDSIYGAGGVHDVAKEFKSSLANKNIEVVLDETLHIPHNSSAYTRSSVTAENLLATERPDAMFDVHRDGVGKSYYYVNIDGQELSKIRIVVGKSNPNFEENYQFAQDVFALGNSMYPWLFADVYCGKGHYNQALQPTDLLFEMGTYMIEKEYVLASIPYLADVVDIALYGSEDDGNGNLIVDANQSENNEENTNNNNENINNNPNNSNNIDNNENNSNNNENSNNSNENNSNNSNENNSNNSNENIDNSNSNNNQNTPNNNGETINNSNANNSNNNIDNNQNNSINNGEIAKNSNGWVSAMIVSIIFTFFLILGAYFLKKHDD